MRTTSCAGRTRTPAQRVRVFRAGGTRPRTMLMVAFINAQHAAYGVESICAVLPIASSTYYEHPTQGYSRQAPPGASTVQRLGYARRFGACTTRTSRPRARARCGTSSGAKGSGRRALRRRAADTQGWSCVVSSAATASISTLRSRRRYRGPRVRNTRVSMVLQ